MYSCLVYFGAIRQIGDLIEMSKQSKFEVHYMNTETKTISSVDCLD